jgi:transcriptional regulator with XRE-family HTH domain
MADFAGEVRRLMGVRGISLRGLAKAASYDPSYLSKVLSGHKPSSPYLAARLDDALGAGGTIRGRHPAATATPEKQSQRTAAEAIGRGRGAPGRDDR